ncbi:hypothetical protein IC582_030146 [Cucumis melo]
MEEDQRGNYCDEEEKEHSNKRKNNKSGKALSIEDEKNNNSDDVCSLSPTISTVGMKFDLANDFMSKEFVEFLYKKGIDVKLMDSKKVKDLKKKYGEVQICRSQFEFKYASLFIKLENLKLQQFQRALQKFS